VNCYEKKGFQCTQAIDNDPAAICTYRANFQDHVTCKAIDETTPLGAADVIIGGPPCQGFSSAGLRRQSDKRNTLVRVFANLIAKHQPRAFVFENVEGFLTSSNGDRVFDLLEPLIETGYRIHLRKINAANFGVPQHRKRVIAIGGLGWDPSYPEPTHMAFGAPGASNNYRYLPLSPTLITAISNLPSVSLEPPGELQGHYIRPASKDDLKRIKLLKPGQTMRDLPQELWHNSYRKRAFRRVKDGTPTEKRGGAPAGLKRLVANAPSKAITSGAITEVAHPKEDRFLTLRECARLQTFPDSFVFSGSIGQIILQIGNAVPPKLAGVFAANIKQDLEQNKNIGMAGALLSFIPTISTGMSPALQKVCERVRKRFLTGMLNNESQLKLWD
jgi:DNA (cytosine-5)-methyltransferase 1